MEKEGEILKKIVGVLLVSSILLFSACSSDNKTETTDSTSKRETALSSTKDSQKKEADRIKKQAEEAEKKKQEEIAKKVFEADTAMKNAEANPTDETLAAAKKAIEAIPGGNADLSTRLEAATANLEAIKQQAAAQAQQQSSDMPADWWGTAADWEQAKAQGWTKEGYEQQQRASENESNPTTSPEQDMYNLSLSEFINKYGMTPAAYQMQNGMTAEEALQNTPQDKKTSGEIQTENLREQGLE